MDQKARALIDNLWKQHELKEEEYFYILEHRDLELETELFSLSRQVREEHFGKEVYIRGLIEFTNYCKNDCFYCGIRCKNTNASRYRLTKEEILSCCENGYGLGFRTFVLQGGEDPYFTDEIMTDIIRAIRETYPDCAITLSMGERTKEQYQRYYDAGANRYLLRHETANEEHYGKLHPKELSLANRKECLFHLKEIGFQVGTGFMVGSPYQTNETIAQDLAFIQQLRPQMVGIGPFIPHKDTKFADAPAGTKDDTLFFIGLIRLMLPNALIPATTALGTIEAKGREEGIMAGANVLMPNLSPITVRKKYDLYDNKICTGEEAAECNACLRKRVESVGYEIVESRGDYQEK